HVSFGLVERERAVDGVGHFVHARRRVGIEDANRAVVDLGRVLATVRDAQHGLPQAAAPVLEQTAAAEHLAQRLLQTDGVAVLRFVFDRRRLQVPSRAVRFAQIVGEDLFLHARAIELARFAALLRLSVFLGVGERLLLRVVALVLGLLVLGL